MGRTMVNSIRPRSISVMACLALFVALIAATPARAQTAYAVTASNALTSFDVNTPNNIVTGYPKPLKDASGAALGAQIVAMDFRPLTGRLYGVGSDNLIYIIDPLTATATPLPAFSPATVLAGTVGMDFDPVTGRIRIVTSTGQNLRVTLDSGTPSTPVTTDLPINGPGAPSVTGLAFTNNFASPD